MALSVLSERQLTGNRCVLRASGGPVGGRIVGVGTAGSFGTVRDVGGNSDFGLLDVYGLGHAERQEIVIGAVRHSITINALLMNEADQGFDPRDIISNGGFTIEVIDRKDGSVLAAYENCRLRTFNGTFPSNGLVTESMTFEATTAQKMAVT